ncbi:bile acid:sodium symporter [Tepidicella xavieri]|jgi:ACR3 family arsenite efflux pump ArsB|uniref:ACR3 family arsenite efflux pump ArsB n=1 Tax=Tepidicella xavieri TaxID=360241 RepID=A0A4R6U7V4_9BURK|nr:bile acid:sodium symporter [Tepidicella xavieri]TDQ41772.1 ACR3 family arsenite efflux pump ArsB [Tepidicella xavieri]
MSRLALERHQVWCYLLGIAAGLAVGTAWPGAAGVMEAWLWPVIGLLLFATFFQIPLLHLRAAWRDGRFAQAVLVGNFVGVPLLVWALVVGWGLEGPVQLGVLLVLLVPCTDWFITFSQLGRGDVPRAIAVTPLNLVLQLLLLPVYLWLMADTGSLARWRVGDLLAALLLVLGPLALAALAERWVERRPARGHWREKAAWWPVPLLTLVVFLIAGAQVGAVSGAWQDVSAAVLLFVAFLALMLGLAWGLARWYCLPPAQGRTLAFSLGTRNSFVVLPIALTLPGGWEVAAVVIVAQSLVELFGMVFYVWVVPRYLFPDAGGH